MPRYWFCWGELPERPIRRRGRLYCGERCVARDPDVAVVDAEPVSGEQLTLI